MNKLPLAISRVCGGEFGLKIFMIIYRKGESMNEIIQSLEANAINGEEAFCYISENKLNAMKLLAKKEQENYNKLLADRDMYKSDNYILRTKSKENDKKYLKILEEKNKKIKELEEELSVYKNKQIDIFGGN